MIGCRLLLGTSRNGVCLLGANVHKLWLSSSSASDAYVSIRWKNKNDSITTTRAKVGETLLSVARANGIDIEGACDGVCACSTCHVIMEPKIFDQLPAASEIEEDMLDLAFGLTSTSRLGCQIVVEPSHDNILITLPKATRNFYVVRKSIDH